MFYSGYFWDIECCFLLSLSFWQSFFNDSCSDSLLLHPLSMLAAFSFYSVILGFRIPLIPPFWLPWYQSLCYASHFWQLILSLFLIVSFFWCLFPKSSLLTFLPGMSLKSYLLISFPSRLLHLTFSDSAFLATFPFAIFLELADSLSASLKVFRTYFPSCFFLLGSLRYQLLVHK